MGCIRFVLRNEKNFVIYYNTLKFINDKMEYFMSFNGLNRNIKYAISGLGYFGKDILRILSNIEGAEISAVYTPNSKNEFLKDMGIKHFNDREKMFKEADFDALIVSSPNYKHYDDVMYAAANKKHIFCEKPAALSYIEAKEMIETCQSNDLVFMAGHILYFMNGVRKAKELIRNGAIGDLLFCHAERTGWEYKQEKVSWKKMKQYSGGHLFHHIHELDLVQSILGDARSVYTMGGNLCHNGEGFGDEDDALFLSLKFDNNRFATMQYGSAFHYGKHFVLINGTDGSIELNFTDTAVTLIKEDNGKKIYEKFLMGDTLEEDEERIAIYKNTNAAVAYGNPNIMPPKWLTTILTKELECFNYYLNTGKFIDKEYEALFNGKAALSSVKTAEYAMRSLEENTVINIQ